MDLARNKQFSVDAQPNFSFISTNGKDSDAFSYKLHHISEKKGEEARV